MAYGMKHTKGGFPFKTGLPADLSGTKGDGVKADMFKNKGKATSGPRATIKATNEKEWDTQEVMSDNSKNFDGHSELEQKRGADKKRSRDANKQERIEDAKGL